MGKDIAMAFYGINAVLSDTHVCVLFTDMPEPHTEVSHITVFQRRKRNYLLQTQALLLPKT